MESHYTLFYCYMHDCGCVIKGEYEYTPIGYNMAHAENCARECDTSDWFNMGVITYDGNKVIIDYRKKSKTLYFSTQETFIEIQ